jgi:hypothetical protein
VRKNEIRVSLLCCEASAGVRIGVSMYRYVRAPVCLTICLRAGEGTVNFVQTQLEWAGELAGQRQQGGNLSPVRARLWAQDAARHHDKVCIDMHVGYNKRSKCQALRIDVSACACGSLHQQEQQRWQCRRH